MSDFILQWESPRLGYFWHHNFVHEVYEKRIIERMMGGQEECFLAQCTADRYSFYLRNDEFEGAATRSRAFFCEPTKLNEWLKTCRSLTTQITALSFETNSKDKTKSQLIGYISDLLPLFYEAVGAHLVTQPHLTSVLEDDLRSMLQKMSVPNINKLISTVTRIEQIPNVLREQLDWYNLLVASGFDAEKALAGFQRHLEQWKYITAGDSKGPMDLAGLKQRAASDLFAIDSIIRQRDQLEALANGQVRAEVLEGEESLPEEARCLARALRTAAETRFSTKEAWMKLWYLLEKSLFQLQELANVDTPKFDDLVLEELEDWSSYEDDRSTYLYFRSKAGSRLYYNGTDSAEVRAEFLQDIDFRAWAGVSGQPGFFLNDEQIEGRALVISWNDNLEVKLKAVDSETILVVPQTTPAYVGALVRVKALVVDEGGITGHASIVSRELQIPSVIGTRVATRVFLDGDALIVKPSEGTVEKRPG